ncbi:unnamed protein product [Knipowitschia caucasica]
MYKDYRSTSRSGINPLSFDPAANNEPLQFGGSSVPLVSECPPLENGAENSKKRKRSTLPTAEVIHNIPMDSSSMSMPMSEPSAWATAMNNLGMPQMGLGTQTLLPDYDPNLGLMTDFSTDYSTDYSSMNMMTGLGMIPDVPVVKEIIHCKSCTLFPPNPNLPPPATRDRPPGCKTVFVGGLPENSSEETVEEIFGPCGPIIAIRKSKKNFCHIRFAEEYTVDRALYLSGYRIRMGSSTDKKDSGRIHVDFAQARDDLYEWECFQRMLAREERHRRKVEEDRMRPPSPPPIVHYSDHECSLLGDKFKDDVGFAEAVQVLVTWLERGEVNRRNANNFYSMIQLSNSHIRRLMSEKAQHEKEMEEAKDKFKSALAGILGQFEQIVSVFQAASKQKARDHFTKAQRKNLDVWRKQVQEIRNVHSEQLMGIRREEEMEMSDDDMEDPSKSKHPENSAMSQAEALKEENDSLRCQLDAYMNEVELLKQEQNQPQRSEEETTHSQQLSFLQQALQGMQTQLIKMQEELKQRQSDLEKSLDEKQRMKKEVQSLKEGLQNLQSLQRTEERQLGTPHKGGGGGDGDEGRDGGSAGDGGEAAAEESADADQSSEVCEASAVATMLVSCSQEKEAPAERSLGSPVQSEREALLVGIICTFLHVHPFGASLEYICSYLQRLDSKIGTSEVELLLSRLPCTFRQELTGVGASLEKRWNFCGFQGIKSL